MELKVPLPRMPKGVQAQKQADGNRLQWQVAVDADDGPVAGYNVYRSSSADGFFTKINTELITTTEYVDTDSVSASDGGGAPTYYYTITSEDDNGDESAQTLPISPAAIESAAGEVVACFIGTATQSNSRLGLWMLGILTCVVVIAQRHTAPRKTA